MIEEEGRVEEKERRLQQGRRNGWKKRGVGGGRGEESWVEERGIGCGRGEER